MSRISSRIEMQRHDRDVRAFCGAKKKELRVLTKYLIQDFDTPQAERHLRTITHLLMEVRAAMCG